MNDIGIFYDKKMEKIINEFGPGPIVHYHTGIECSDIKRGDGIDCLRTKMKESQKNILDLIICKIGNTINEDSTILDIGCGLGGTSLYLAKEMKVNAIGISLSKDNIVKAKEFADQLRLDKVEFYQSDALTFSYKKKIDTAVALESICYMDREKIFQKAHQLLKKESYFHVFDWEILEESSYSKKVDNHWKTKMGSSYEYNNSAKKANFELVEEREMNKDAAKFYDIVLQWNKQYYENVNKASYEYKKYKNTITAIKKLIKGFTTGNICLMYQIYRNN
jgi:tocopherol O-methyltransferase